MSDAQRRRPQTAAQGGSWAVYWVLMGLAYHIIYHGIPWPLQLSTWLHVLGWPVYVMLGLLRWIFIPFAAAAFLGAVILGAVHARWRR
jgi:hypothetical protein